ncbi:AAA family ATPase [Lipingzhangella sp. LS1_29]|uniref:Nuclease SbcCD subunit C n=1 Tax=Lipingzhangella rawalii TaxID=2055835 RepID=A0ABU2H3V5_9ACTN|nr:AAA family ATPase [Lipingzhangella rawalii]MDS1269980.1 AAA family ATPase [Lipingzhangella rawalii]
METTPAGAGPSTESGPESGRPGPTAQRLLRQLRRSELDDAARQWVVAALRPDGGVALDACGRGEQVAEPELGAPAPAPPSIGECFLSQVQVQGYRGIGRVAQLQFPPRPGLTIVVGRNGTGKSSFAEAIESALTGRDPRWEQLPASWRDGWRNIHVEEDTLINVDVHPTGGGALRISRTWHGDSARSSRGTVTLLGAAGDSVESRRTGSLADLGWSEVLTRYRPFLSSEELGRTITGRSAELYDTLTALLGLTEVTAAERALAQACDRLAKQERRAVRELPRVREYLAASSDPRARQAVNLLDTDPPDLDQLGRIAEDNGPADRGRQLMQRRLRRLSVPERAVMTDVVHELRGAAMELAMQADTAGERAHSLVALLRTAVEHQERHATTSDCPTCGSSGVIDAGWSQRMRAEIDRLQPLAATAASAYERAEAARDQARFLLAAPPSWLPADTELGRVWAEWSTGANITDLGELADHIENVGRRLRASAQAARREATEQAADPTDGWAELAESLGSWVAEARAAQQARQLLAPASAALEWLTEAARHLREERLRPVAAHAEHIWRSLRQERHIDLEAMRLVGRGARRRVAVDVQLAGGDGTPNSPGVLSQGESQALALSICLPRALASDNPFGFLVLDDPVQAMDTETVGGLANVLSEVAQQRQIIVLTHDSRLPDAVRQAGLPATIWTIDRDETSNVWITNT